MNKAFKKFLMGLVAKNTISVFNDETGSDYQIPTPGIEGYLLNPSTPISAFDKMDIMEECDFIISCQYVLNGGVPLGVYRLEYGDMVLETASAPLFSTPKNQKARDLISLARACSKKIIAQQKMAQTRNMIMGMTVDHSRIS